MNQKITSDNISKIKKNERITSNAVISDEEK